MGALKKIIPAFILIVFINVNAQKAVIDSEIGIYFGPTFMQTDYGEANNFKSSVNNGGFGFGVAYIADYSNLTYNSKLLSIVSKHLKTRLEFSYSKTIFEYDGKPVSNEGSLEYENYKAMKGETKLYNIGVFGEIYFLSLRYSSKIQPYIIAGVSYSIANPSLKTTKPLPRAFTPKSENVFLEKQNVFSFSSGLGLRYKLNAIDFLIESRFNSFFSDRIEGLDSNVAADKNNDTQVIFNIGVVFHFNDKSRNLY